MQPSQLNSVVLPVTGSRNPATLMKAAQIPLRIVIYNAGPIIALLAHEPGTLGQIPVFANARILPPDREITLVLAPGQGVYAVGAGAGAVLSVAVSEALPIKGPNQALV
jgi:hypothetical protein